jgi:hypothetical protein
MSMSTEFQTALKLAEEMAELIEVAALDEDVTITLQTDRETSPGGLVAWALVQRLILQGWSFSYDGKNDYARGGDITHDPSKS